MTHAGGEAAIPFVDAHIHLWDLTRLRYPWLTPPFADDGPNGSVEPIASTYQPADYRREMARWNVVGAVHVDAGADPADALAETEWLEGLAEADGLPTGIVAFAALDDPEVETVLAAHARHPRVRGIRHIVNWHADPQRSYTPRDVTQDDAWQRGFAALARHGLSFDLQCYPGQMPAMAALAARHPEVPVIVNHAGMAVLSDADGYGEWRRGLAALAACPQVAVKLSGFGFARRDWDAAFVRDMVRTVIDLFGPERAMFASDLPTDRLFGAIDAQMEACHAAVIDYSDSDRRALFAGNANRIYRLGLDLPLTKDNH
ncbi:MAG: amidohydrolase family protein [Sphingomonas aquatilis]|jgi:predicted TIM-barrel fold metal-dependent hydrolase|uniref:amidohydrolase family protein n=1 Tax=Sphingomonas aquatilis TaxID=93063 RepID=UPI002F2DB617